MSWFGPSWGAPICDPGDHVATPIGRPCLRCGKLIVDGDQGLVSPYVRLVDGVTKATIEPTHIDCFLESIRPCPGCAHCQPGRFN